MTVATAERAPKARAAAKASGLKLTVDRALLLHALTHAASIVERRNTIPILSNVLLDATDGALKVIATDLDLQIALTVDAAIETEGATTVSATLLHGIVRELQSGSQIDLALGEGRLNVSGGRSRYKLQTLPRDDFPVIKPVEAQAFSLPAADLVRTFGRIAFAQSTEMTRYYLNGVNVSVEDGALVFAATEGNALAWSKLPAPDGVDAVDAILPTKLVSTLTKLLDGDEGDVRLAFEGDRRVTIEAGDAVVTSKLIDGSFPNWRRVIPMDSDKKMLIAAGSFAGAIKRASMVANERTRAVKLSLSQDKLTITVASPEFGTAQEEMPCVWDGGEFEAGFNSRYLLGVLGASGADEVEVALIDAAAPALISNPADNTAKWVVMPMRV